jgi:hypothetical protein
VCDGACRASAIAHLREHPGPEVRGMELWFCGCLLSGAFAHWAIIILSISSLF